MRTILVLSIFLCAISLSAKYESADELSRKIPIISTPKLTESSSISLRLGRTLNTTYTTDYLLGLNYYYMLGGSLGIIVDGYYGLSTDSDLNKQLKDQFEKASAKITLPNYSSNMASFSGGLIFRPVYGKISFFSEKVVHFDFYITMMGGVALVNLYRKPEGQNDLEKEMKIAGLASVSIGQNYFLTNNLALGLEFKDTFTFGTQAKEDDVFKQTMSLRMSISYFF